MGDSEKTILLSMLATVAFGLLSKKTIVQFKAGHPYGDVKEGTKASVTANHRGWGRNSYDLTLLDEKLRPTDETRQNVSTKWLTVFERAPKYLKKEESECGASSQASPKQPGDGHESEAAAPSPQGAGPSPQGVEPGSPGSEVEAATADGPPQDSLPDGIAPAGESKAVRWLQKLGEWLPNCPPKIKKVLGK